MYNCSPSPDFEASLGRFTGNSLYCTTPRLKPSTGRCPAGRDFLRFQLVSSGPMPARGQLLAHQGSLSASGGSVPGQFEARLSRVRRQASRGGEYPRPAAVAPPVRPPLPPPPFRPGFFDRLRCCRASHSTQASARIADQQHMADGKAPPLLTSPICLQVLPSSTIRLPTAAVRTILAHPLTGANVGSSPDFGRHRRPLATGRLSG